MPEINIDFGETTERLAQVWKRFLAAESDATLSAQRDPALGRLTWPQVVKRAAETGDDAFLRRYGALRSALVDGALSIAFIRAGATCATCTAFAAGSQTPTSDYDITVFGHKSSEIVRHFYETFRSLFQLEPALMFDSNVYGGPSFFTVWSKSRYADIPPETDVYKRVYNALRSRQQTESPDDFTVRTLNANDDLMLSTLQSGSRAEAETSFCAVQIGTSQTCVRNPGVYCTHDRCWAMLAFMRHVPTGDEQSAALATFEKCGLSSDVATYTALALALEDDRKRFQKEPSMLHMGSKTDYYLDLIDRSQKVQATLFDHLVDPSAPRKTLVDNRNLLRHTVSHASLYGEEMYVTSGAVLHVVVARQMGFGAQLPNLLFANDLYGSYMENAGYAYHVFESTKSNARFVDSPFCSVAIVRGSKYLARTFDALLRQRKALEKSSDQKGGQKSIEQLGDALAAAEIARTSMRSKINSATAQQVFTTFSNIVGNSGIYTLTERPCDRALFLKRYVEWVGENVRFFQASNPNNSVSTK